MKRETTGEPSRTHRLVFQSSERNEIYRHGLELFDFSKRSHQAAFWILLNCVVYGESNNRVGLVEQDDDVQLTEVKIDLETECENKRSKKIIL